MKEGWEYIALSSVCKVQNGFAFNSKLFNESNNGLPLIRIRDIKRGYSLTYTSEICSDEFFVEDGDMLIGMDGDFNIGEWKGGHALLNQRVCKLIPSEKILAKFIFYFIPEALQRINDKTAFSTVKHLSSKQVNAILLPNLPLSEQQSIVDYLDSAFAKIDAMKANAEKALNEAKALFQASLKEMLEPKEGWITSTLEDECFKITDGTHQTPKYFPSGYIFLSSKNVTSRKIDWEDVKFIDEDQHQLMHKRVAPQIGDILLAKNGTTGVAAMVERDVVFDIYVSLALLRSKGNVTPEYLLTFVNSPIAKEQFDKRLIGMGVPNLHLGEIKQVVITYPKDKGEQVKITQRIEELDNLIISLQENYEKISQECDALKQAILRQIFE